MRVEFRSFDGMSPIQASLSKTCVDFIDIKE